MRSCASRELILRSSNNYANMSTRNVKTSSAPAATKAKAPSMTQEQKEEAMRKATEYYNKNAAKPEVLLPRQIW